MLDQPKYNRILVPIGVIRSPDSEAGDPLAAPGSLRAVQYACLFAEGREATVHLLYVVPQFAMAVAGWESQAGDAHGGREVFRPIAGPRRVSPEAISRERLSEIGATYLGSSVKWTILTRIGQAAEQIIEAVKEENIDLLVIPRRRKRPKLEELLLGSVTYKVVRAVACNVFIVGDYAGVASGSL